MGFSENTLLRPEPCVGPPSTGCILHGRREACLGESKLFERVEAFEAIVEAHDRYCQFHLTKFLVAMLLSHAAWCPSLGDWPLWSDLGLFFLSAVFFFYAISRDNLRR